MTVGGWTYSKNFARPASSTQGRSMFASSAISLIANLGLDGLEIDWEYPENEAQAKDLVTLFKTVREALDAYGESLVIPYHFKLTVAAPGGQSNYKWLYLSDMDQYVDFWNLMAYDYTGSWSPVTGHQANLFKSATDTKSTPVDTETVINFYISNGVDARKIVLGMPLYGQSFQNTNGLGQPYKGVGNGTWEAGTYDLKVLPLAGATTYYSRDTGSSYSYNNITKELVSYDTVAVAKQKADWIRQMGLGGAMWWESSADGEGDQSRIQKVEEVLRGKGASELETSLNQLSFLNSTYDNIRAGMPNNGLDRSPLASSSTSTPLIAPPLLTSTSKSTRTVALNCTIHSTAVFSTSTISTSATSPPNYITTMGVPAFTTTTRTTTIGGGTITTGGQAEGIIALLPQLFQSIIIHS